MSHQDIRIGTLAPMDKGAAYLKQILPHGFESFALTLWQKIGSVNIDQTAKEVLELLGDRAVISSLGLFGNPLRDAQTAKDWEQVIKKAKLFKTNIVAGFTGAIEDKPLPESLPQFKKVWTKLAKLAQDHGVKIAWENCDMGGRWDAPRLNIAHAPSAWEMMFNEVPFDNVGLQWEPAHQLTSLVEPLPQLRKWVNKVFHIHGKDATIAWDVLKEYGLRGGKQYVWHRTPGFGDTNWTDVISILRQAKWTGAIDIEGWHDPVYRDALEMTGQVHGLNYLKNCRGGTFVANPK
ncbi:MAG: sugar phosphate isomerase/epimerase [Phycisphaerae bacterium]